MPITEVYGADDPATALNEHDLGARPPSSGGSSTYPGHEHDNDASDLGANYDVIDQEWHSREAQGAELAWQAHVPTSLVGQDAQGGHQGVDITLALFQPAAGAQLEGSAVQQALGRDYDRLEARVLAIDGPIICCTSKEQAEQAYAQGLGAATVIPGPWTWQPSGTDRVRRNGDELWIAIPGATAAATHVSIIVSRRLPVGPRTLAE